MTDDDAPAQGDLFATVPNPFPIGPLHSRYEQMRVAAGQFHREHPEVWRLFVQFTFDRIDRGFTHYSAKAVFERIRWETGEADVDERVEFKVNNNHAPFYARAFMRMYPERDGFFRTRAQTSLEGAEAPRPELGPQDFE